MSNNLKKILFFDTETTGLTPGDDRIIQFGAIYGTYNTDTKEFIEGGSINQFIRCEKESNEFALKVHGITTEFLKDYGTMDQYIRKFLAYMAKCDYIVAHNIQYDRNMLQGEMKLLGIEFGIPAEKLCTLEKGKTLCRPTKLANLHEHLFNEGFEGAHDAMADITATKRCFLEMVRRGYFTL